MSETDRKIDLTMRLYLDPGDEDYLSARWAYCNGMFHSFYWSAAQACEKYLKAALLLQDRSAKNYGHDLLRLFNDVRSSDPNGIVPANLQLPETTALGREAWEGANSERFIEYLAQFGSPDNRYAFHGTFVDGPVLHALDSLCCSFRTLMRRTNLTEDDLFAHQSRNLLFHEKIESDQMWMIDPTRLLERLFTDRYSVGQDQALRAVFCNMNWPFSPTRSEGEHSFGGQHLHGSPLYNHLVRLRNLSNSPENLAAIEKLRAWADQNIQMSKAIRKELGFTVAPHNKS